MPLSDPADRELLHLRDIELRGYRRADGLFDIEARLTDTKTYAFNNQERGEITPGTPVHRMLARMTLSPDMVITQFEAATEFSPFSICPNAAPNFSALAGLKVGPGFLKAANERVGGGRGCTHLRELLGQMGTVAFQTMYAVRRQQPQAQKPSRPPLLNTCLAYADGSPVARRVWPHLYEDAAGPAGD